MPASRNEIHTAAPATAPAAPSSEKMPAPTMDATPMNAACVVETYCRGGADDKSAPGVSTTGTADSVTVHPPLRPAPLEFGPTALARHHPAGMTGGARSLAV